MVEQVKRKGRLKKNTNNEPKGTRWNLAEKTKNYISAEKRKAHFGMGKFWLEVV